MNNPNKAKLLPIRIYGDEILRKVAREVQIIDNDIKAFIKDLTHTMYERDGVGLAANQVGKDIRIFVVDTQWSQEGASRVPKVMINPSITSRSGEEENEEGCISLPGIYAKVRRAGSITISYTDPEGNQHTEEAEGFKAVAIQHEYDHLNGVLFVDHLGTLAKLKIKRKLKDLEKTTINGENIRTEIYRPED